MKVYFAWHDRKGRTPWRIRLSFERYWSGELWYFNLWKWSMIWDFRKGNFITWMLADIKKRQWFDILKKRKN